MTRNLYLGADLTPAIQAPAPTTSSTRTGRSSATSTPTTFRPGQGAGAGDPQKQPDLVGLQEVSLWRSGPVNDGAPFTCNGTENDNPPFGCDFTASTVRYDYLKDLLQQLNKGGHQLYKVVISQREFDFEAPTDYNGVPGDGDSPANMNGEENDRLTMRDVILKRLNSGVVTTNVKAGHFRHLY